MTNLKAVLDGAKPKLEKVDAALTHVEEGSDLKWLDGGDAYEFTRRSTYVARDAAEEARPDNRSSRSESGLPRYDRRVRLGGRHAPEPISCSSEQGR